MTRTEFTAARRQLLLSRSQLSRVLGVRPGYVENIEDAPWMARGMVPEPIARLMEAFLGGWRGQGWPKRPALSHAAPKPRTDRQRLYAREATSSDHARP